LAVRIEQEDFDLAKEHRKLLESCEHVGAVVSFVGFVRDLDYDLMVDGLTIEHYPGMTEKSLEDIISQAKNRWSIIDALIIHRVGHLAAKEQIVAVLVAAMHRQDAFLACEFIMDYLKTQAPFWKKQHTNRGDSWVEAKHSDELATSRWKN
jgi:molybdopterin synthase catalytic subunit